MIYCRDASYCYYLVDFRSSIPCLFRATYLKTKFIFILLFPSRNCIVQVLMRYISPVRHISSRFPLDSYSQGDRLYIFRTSERYLPSYYCHLYHFEQFHGAISRESISAILFSHVRPLSSIRYSSFSANTSSKSNRASTSTQISEAGHC